MRVHALVPDLATAERAVEAGATVVQLRLKGAPSPEVVRVGNAVADRPADRAIFDGHRAGRAL